MHYIPAREPQVQKSVICKISSEHVYSATCGLLGMLQEENKEGGHETGYLFLFKTLAAKSKVMNTITMGLVAWVPLGNERQKIQLSKLIMCCPDSMADHGSPYDMITRVSDYVLVLVLMRLGNTILASVSSSCSFPFKFAACH